MSFFLSWGRPRKRLALLMAGVRGGPLRSRRELGAPRTGGRPARIFYRAVRRATWGLRVPRRRRRRRRPSCPYMSPSSPSSNCRYSLRQSINSPVPSTHSSLSGSQVSAMGSWCSHRTRYSLTSRIDPLRSRLTHLWSTMWSTTYSSSSARHQGSVTQSV